MAKFGMFSSSVDSQKLASSIEGALKAFAGALGFFGLGAVSGDVVSLAEQVGLLVTAGFAFFGVLESVFGLVRKIIAALTSK